MDRAAYTSAGLPWFDYYYYYYYYYADAEDLAAAAPLTEVQPVGDWLGDDGQAWVDPNPAQVHQLKDDGGQVTDGNW